MSVPPINATGASARPDESVAGEIQALEDSIAPFRDFYELQRGSGKPEINKTLNRGWTPGFVRECRTKCYFNHAKPSDAVYGEPLFDERTNLNETLFRGLGYAVDREVVVSMGKRLTELGTQKVAGGDGLFHDIPLNLQEHGDSGEQALIYTRHDVPPPTNPLPRGEGDGGRVASPIDYDGFEASLIKAYDVPGAVKIEKSPPNADRIQKIHAEYALPAEITWDGKGHAVNLDFEAKFPKEGKKNFITWLMRLINMNNGRPAQHYQDTAVAVIDLQEILFADKKSIRLTIDGEPVLPDKLNGNRLALLLSQTAGGFFEGKYYQPVSGGEQSLYQKTETGIVQPNLSQHIVGRTRITTIGLNAAPYLTNYYEDEVALDKERTAYELTEMRFYSADGASDFIDISFSTGDGRGIRDLGYFSPREQTGRFKFRVNGRDGFAFGDFTVLPTQKVWGDDDNPVYYTSITLDPKHSKDMANKRIILHVVHTKEGVYSETQIVPLGLVTPPPFEVEQ